MEPHVLTQKSWSRLTKWCWQGEEPRPAKCRRRHHAERAGFSPIADPGRNGGEASAGAAREMRARKSGGNDGRNFRNRISQKKPRSGERSKKVAAREERRRLRLRKSKRTVWRHLSRALI